MEAWLKRFSCALSHFLYVFSQRLLSQREPGETLNQQLSLLLLPAQSVETSKRHEQFLFPPILYNPHATEVKFLDLTPPRT